METRNNNPRAFYVVHPGDVLGEELKARRIRQLEFAERIGMQASHLNALIKGKRNVSPQLALRLEDALDIPANVWLDLQDKYDLSLMRTSDLVKGYSIKPANTRLALNEPTGEYGRKSSIYLQGKSDGKAEERVAIIQRMRAKGFTDDEIREIVGE